MNGAKSSNDRRLSLRLWPVALLPFAWLGLVLDAVVSRRGRCLIFVAVSAVIACSGWLRPPLSRDVRAFYIPLQVGGAAVHAEEILKIPRSVRMDSIGVLLLSVLAGAGLLLMVFPGRLPAVAAILLVVAIAANISLGLNYPTLLDQLEAESEQRQQIARVLVTLHPDSVAHGAEPRVSLSQNAASLWRGFDYLLYGPWLIVWSAFGLLLSLRGSLARRLGWLALCSAGGLIAATALCLPRIRAEYHYAAARYADARGAFPDAKHQLDRAAANCPALARAWQYRQLHGKLLFRLNRSALDRELWQIDQWIRNREDARALARINQLLVDPALDPDSNRVVAQLYNQVGLEYWTQGRWVAAGAMWQKAMRLDGTRWDSPFLMATVQARMDRNQPDRVYAELAPILARMADRVLRADLLSSLGDVYFDAGQLAAARSHYEASIRAFELPKEINYRARRGLVGM